MFDFNIQHLKENLKDKKTKRILIYIGSLLLIIFIFLTIKILSDIPSISKLENYTPNLITKIYDVNGKVIDELYIEKRTLIPLSEIPKDMINAIIATEDNNFYNHWGISIVGIFRALISNLFAGKVVQGGSTITQQLAKGIFLTREKTITRKIKELILSLELEYNYSKEEILELYLNQIYFGNSAYGISSASRIYFDKPVQKLTLEECAMLAGLPKAPSYFSPVKNPDASLNRRNFVLKRMVQNKFISEEQEKEAVKIPLNIVKNLQEKVSASYFVEYIRQDLEQRYGDLLYKGGLKIYTSLDLDIQRAAEQAMNTGLSEFDKNKCTFIIDKIKQNKIKKSLLKYIKQGTPSYKLIKKLHKYYKENPEANADKINESIAVLEQSLPNDLIPVQGALIALNPKTGEIRAMVGGRDFNDSQFNRAVQAKRQPGSSFKVCIYTAAIDKGFKATDTVEDSPMAYYNNGVDWELVSKTTDYSDMDPALKEKIDFKDIMKFWAPQNYSKKYSGQTNIRYALQKSINISAVDLLIKIGPKTAVEYARKLGIGSNVDPYLSMALGSFVVTPIELVTVFATIANYGVKTTPYTIVKILDHNDQILENHNPEEQIAISAQTAYLMTNLLRGVVAHGTGIYASKLGRPAAGKTGTTNEYTDAWFLGYVPQLVAGVWVGYDNCSKLGPKMTGGYLACPIWTNFMAEALKNQPILDFKVPSNIVFKKIDPQTGLLAMDNSTKTYIEAFLKGTEPKDYYYSMMGKKVNTTITVEDEEEDSETEEEIDDNEEVQNE